MQPTAAPVTDCTWRVDTRAGLRSRHLSAPGLRQSRVPRDRRPSDALAGSADGPALARLRASSMCLLAARSDVTCKRTGLSLAWRSSHPRRRRPRFRSGRRALVSSSGARPLHRRGRARVGAARSRCRGAAALFQRQSISRGRAIHPGGCLDRRRGRACLLLALVGGPTKDQPLPAVVRCREAATGRSHRAPATHPPSQPGMELGGTRTTSAYVSSRQRWLELTNFEPRRADHRSACTSPHTRSGAPTSPT